MRRGRDGQPGPRRQRITRDEEMCPKLLGCLSKGNCRSRLQRATRGKLNDMVRLRSDGPLGNQSQGSRDNPVPVRRRIGTVVAQNDLQPVDCLLEPDVMTAIRPSHHSRQDRSQWRGRAEEKPQQATCDDPPRDRRLNSSCFSPVVHYGRIVTHQLGNCRLARPKSPTVSCPLGAREC